MDLGEVTEMDSSLLAAIVAWLRDARRAGRRARVRQLPDSVRTIARLYGVDELIPAASR